MKFSAAAITVLHLLTALSYPANVTARLSAGGGSVDGGDSVMDNDKGNQKKNDVRYLTWNNDAHQDSALDDKMQTTLAYAKEKMSLNDGPTTDQRSLATGKSKKGKDMVRSNSTHKTHTANFFQSIFIWKTQIFRHPPGFISY